MKRLSKKDIEARYDRLGWRYTLIEYPFELLFVRRFRKNLLRLARGRVLETGIGTGNSLRYYPEDCGITGIDASKEVLKVARKRAERQGKRIKLIKGDVERLPFRNREFDTVVDVLGICTYPHPVKALKEMKRVCKPHGKILLLQHGVSDRNVLRRAQIKNEQRHHHKHGCSWLRDHVKLVLEAGLKIVEVRKKAWGSMYYIIAKP